MQVIITSHTQCLNKRLQNNSCIVNAQTSIYRNLYKKIDQP